MSAVIWGLSPHPPLLIPEVGGASLDRVRRTREALQEMCREVAERRPDRLVLVTPHGPRHPEAISLLVAEQLSGTLDRFGHPEVRLEVQVDRILSEAVAQAAEASGVGIVRLASGVELDHALLVPLYYLREAGVDVPVVALSVSHLPGLPHWRLGAALREVLATCDLRVAVIASGDLSHRLLESGPYGFDEMGPVFDELVLQGLEAVDTPALLEIPDEMVQRAGQCGLRPILTLLGSLEAGARARVRSYEGPFGVGYAVVQFDPVDPRLRVARRAVEHFVRHGRSLDVPEPVPEDLLAPAPVFVSLKRGGRLRGCIGTLVATFSTQAEEIATNAVGACSRDPRFPPVVVEELEELEIHVYVLGAPERVSGVEDLDPARYGVIVRKDRRSGVLLPGIEGIEVASEQVAIACRKAGIEPCEIPDLERFEVRVWREVRPWA